MLLMQRLDRVEKVLKGLSFGINSRNQVIAMQILNSIKSFNPSDMITIACRQQNVQKSKLMICICSEFYKPRNFDNGPCKSTLRSC